MALYLGHGINKILIMHFSGIFALHYYYAKCQHKIIVCILAVSVKIYYDILLWYLDTPRLLFFATELYSVFHICLFTGIHGW